LLSNSERLSNNAFNPNALRSNNNMAGRACHVVASAAHVGLTDLLVTGENCAKAFSVQVKTNAKVASFWLVGLKARDIVAASHVYAFVNLRREGLADDFYIVPSQIVAKYTRIEKRKNSTWYAIYRNDIAKFKSKWSVAGATNDSVA